MDIIDYKQSTSGWLHHVQMRPTWSDTKGPLAGRLSTRRYKSNVTIGS